MSKRNMYKLIVIIALLVGLEMFSGPMLLSRAQLEKTDTGSDLFQDTLFQGDREPFYNPEIKRTRFVKVNMENFNARGSLDSGSSDTLILDLNLFGGVFFQARLNRYDRVRGIDTWSGRLDNVAHGQAIFAYKDHILSGNISVPGAFYQVRYVGEGIHAIHELDHSKFPACAVQEENGHQDNLLSGSLDTNPNPGSNLSPEVNQKTGVDTTLDSGSSIDVLVVYNEAARSGAGGTTAMETTIALAIAETNTGYANSDVTQRLNLVHSAEVSYTESGSIFTDLSRLRSTSDGYIDHVHALRDTYGADVVAMITEGGGGYCGVASLMGTVSNSFKSSAFSVTKRSCATGYYSFGHELGHNMGARHDRYVDNTDNSPYTHNHGYVSLAGDWRTIMAYNTDCSDNGDGYCSRLNYWSNPAVTYGGLDMGIIDGDPSAADNHLTLDKTANTVANFRSHVTAPTITVTSPNGGESLTGNASETITWSSTGSITNVKIEYSLNNGSSWTAIVSSTANDGSYAWNVTNSTSSQCLIRVSEAVGGSPLDTSNANFTITSVVVPTITVTSPNGGESLTGGTSHTVTWTSTGTVGNVKIEYSLNSGSTWTVIAASTADDGSYPWSVPDSASTQCLLKVSEASDNDPTDSSDAVFTITSATVDSLTMTSPNGGESLSGGASHTVTWTSTGSIADVRLEYSLNNGTNWTRIASNTPNDGSYSWSVPDSASSQCIVRVAEAVNGTPLDSSDSAFTIIASITDHIAITSPNGGESLTGGAGHTVTWSSTGSVGNVKIEYSSDNLSTWTSITASTANDGSYAWTVPQVNSANCFVRVSQVSGGTPTDTSDTKFSITASASDTLTVSSPNGGETLSSGANHTITWISTGSVGNVKLEYSLNNGGSWTTIVSSTANDGSYPWTLPGSSSSQCLVKVSEATDGSPSDSSDSSFTISTASSDTITVGSPNGGESLTGGSKHTIIWSSTGSVSKVKIEYSLNSGSSWAIISSSTTNDGSLAWTVPNSASSTCKVKISDASNLNISDSSNSNFTITITEVSGISVTSPNGGENLTGGTGHAITWTSTGSVGSVKIDYSADGLNTWTTIVSSTTNDGIYNWTVPQLSANKCYIRVSQVSGGTPSDTSNHKFSISSAAPAAITVASPNGGESLSGGSTHTITWSSTGSVGNVKIEYSGDGLSTWNTIIASTVNDGSYGWAVPMLDSKTCYVRITQVSGGSPSDSSNHKFSISSEPPEISVNRSVLNFGGTSSGNLTSAQKLLIRNSGGQTLNWTATADVPWLTLHPSSGSGAALVTVSVTADGLAAGDYSAVIQVSDPNSSNLSREVSAHLKLFNNGASSLPFGEMATPGDNALVSSSIPVTGWVLDDVGVESVKIYNGNSYIGDAVFVEGARPDVESAYSQYPNHYKAGWGYMLLTHFLPNGGNGIYNISARATDKEGQTVTLGSRTITVDNANAVKPFGAIDTPAPGETASGSKFINWGWALTPPPASIATDGSTINVYVDGVNLGHPVYNINRSDIASLFPGYANSDGAAGYFYIDTTAYDYGVHTIQWVVKDSAGQSDGVGSRYFTIYPTNQDSTSSASTSSSPASRNLKHLAMSTPTYSKDPPRPVLVRHNFNDTSQHALPDKEGNIAITVRETGHLEIQLNNGHVAALSPLPIGASLDSDGGIFRWHPGPGFSGTYTFRFALIGSDGLPIIQQISIKVAAKF